MTDYKLMPVEPAADMLGNAMSVCIGFSGDYGTYNCYLSEDAAREVYQAFRAVAPAVQGEPVVWLRFRSRRVAADDVIEGLEICEPGEIGDDGEPALPAYAAPQPAPDVAGLVEALESLLRHAKKMGRTSVLYDNARAALAAHRKQGGEA